MIYPSPGELKDRIEAMTPRRVRGEVNVFEDTSSYMAIIPGGVLRLDGDDYFIMGDTREGRFGIDDQPKFWVKSVIDLTSGERKIIKLVFHEQFSTSIGPTTIRCKRNPHKESAFLDLVRGDGRFMQGRTVEDTTGNCVRIIDFIKGPSFYNHLATMDMPHEQYYHEVLPDLMRRHIIPCIEAMAAVHHQGQHHGDIRNDHILVDRNHGVFTWIDFDYEVNFSDWDVWSMGNIITYAAGMGSHTFHDVRLDPQDYPLLQASLDEHDAMVLHEHRVSNLRKLFPYIDRALNQILMRFSAGSFHFYESLDEQVRELKAVFGQS